MRQIVQAGEPRTGHFVPAGQLLGTEERQRLLHFRFAMMPGSVSGGRLAVLAVVTSHGNAAGGDTGPESASRPGP